jgi:hypothetical protein
MRKPFQLRSGNGMSGSSFKMMGASPMKELIGDQENLDLNNNNKVDGQDLEMLREKNSPAKFGLIGKGLKLLYRTVRGTRKVKKGKKIKSVADEVQNKNVNLKSLKSGGLDAKSRKTLKRIEDEINLNNLNAAQKPISYKLTDFGFDVYIGNEIYKSVKKNKDGSGVETGPISKEIINDEIPYSPNSTKKNVTKDTVEDKNLFD